MTVPILREVLPADWKSLNDLHRWAWFPERSEAGWKWVHGLGQGYPGWVLEDDDGVCGYLGNVRQDYALLDACLVGATGYSLIVLPRARGGSRLLLDAFRSQPGVFATSIFNSNARAAPIYSREGFTAFPHNRADAKIVWPLAPMTILSERLVRSLYRNRRPSRELFSSTRDRPRGPSAAGLSALDPWTDAAAINLFHVELRHAGSLIADRSARALQDRFSDPDRAELPMLYGWREGDRLTAVALGQLGKMSECEAPILDIIDIVWLEPHGAATAALLVQLKTAGRRAGASRMRLSLVNHATAEIALRAPGAVIRRRHIHGHASFFAGMEEDLPWAPTPFDGDFGFCLRPPPTNTPQAGRGGWVSGSPLRSGAFDAGAPLSAHHPQRTFPAPAVRASVQNLMSGKERPGRETGTSGATERFRP
ncbi:MAG: GNAT family N-acetyltransferase [Phenylobacterium sp.]|nr:GNAT family N-acetyltransferase [Phenylobacterium sp.]